MGRDIDIICDNNSYRAALCIENIHAYFAALSRPETFDKHGEALVAALVETAAPGTVSQIQRLKADTLHDGPNGEPALQKFQNGILVYEAHYCDGSESDSVHGEPAEQYFDQHTGDLFLAEHFQRGQFVRRESNDEVRTRNQMRQAITFTYK